MYSKPNHYSEMGFMHLLSVLSYVLISISFTTGQQCYDTRNFTTNSTYANNRNHILSSLVKGVQSNNGFFTGSTGQGSDKVYALALCRGDLSPKECTSCINSTSQVIMTECPNQKEAYKWVAQALCIVRYADRYFYGKLELKPEQGFYNIANLTSDMTQFGKIWGNLTDSLSKKASTSSFRYATEEAHLTAFETIYSQMQCTPDLSQNDCDICLRQYVANYKSCCYGKQGGGFLGPNCLFRWDLYPFYKDIIPLPPPASMPTPPSTIMPERGSGGGGIATAIVVIIVFSTIIIIMVFVALLCVLVRRRRNRKQKISSKQRRENADETETVESLQFNFSTIKVATNDFSNDNKLGQGGFGAVYKGILSDGGIIAVKRWLAIQNKEN